MTLLCKNFWGIIIITFIFFPAISYAGITYTRTSIPPDSFSFEISFDDFGIDSGLGADFSSWGLNMYNIDDADVYQTESIAIDNTTYAFIVPRRNSHIKSIRFYGCSLSNDCSYEGVTIQEGAPPDDSEGGGGGGGVIEEEDEISEGVVGGGRVSYVPEVDIFFPIGGTIFSKEGNVNYKATDKNDGGNSTNERNLGLIKNPVSIFYSDKISEWDHTLTKAEDKILIKKDEPAINNFFWSTENLLPGVLYRVIVSAIDAIGNVGEAVSDFFTVDFSSPVFTIKVDPPVTRKENVNITVDSSKDLKDPPLVKVRQKGAEKVIVKMIGEGSHYEGVYEIIDGHDGVVTIEIEGKDLVGNKSSSIVGGGTFAVGINPPPKPQVDFPKNKQVVSEEVISVRGVAREDTDLIIKLNGVEIHNGKIADNGNFLVKDIPLSKKENKGVNFFSIKVVDQAGLSSEDENIEIKFNKEPIIDIKEPVPNSLVSGIYPLIVDSSDENEDLLTFTYEIISEENFNLSIKDGGVEKEWITIADAILTKQFNFDSTEFDDGVYFIRATVDDGVVKKISKQARVVIKNTLPFFRFENGRKTITSKTSVILKGRAIVPEATYRATILRVDYSLDNGKRWIRVPNIEGVGTSEVKFSLLMDNLKEGTSPILWRVRDSRNLFGRSTHSLIVDRTEPFPPKISNSNDLLLITNKDDSDTSKSGIQLNLKGKTEPFNSVILSLNNDTFTTKAGFDGAFVFKGMSISTRGKNSMKFTAMDEALNKSKEEAISFVYDNPPVITFTNPKNDYGLSDKGEITWKIDDIDNDKIENIILSYRRNEGTFEILAKNPTQNSYTFDTEDLKEGRNNELKLEVKSGFATSTAFSKFFIDKIPPQIESFSLGKNVLGKSDVITATVEARDSLSGINVISFKITPRDSSQNENGNIWYNALITNGFLSSPASGRIKFPFKDFADGVYDIVVKATDASGNDSETKSESINIDTSPPRVGSFLVKTGNISLNPSADGALKVYAGIPNIFNISLENDTDDAHIKVGNEIIELKKSLTSSLWEGEIVLSSASTSEIALSAKDQVNNSFSDKIIGSVSSFHQGKIGFLNENGVFEPLEGVEIDVLEWSEEENNFTEQSSGSFSTKTDISGNYQIVLDPGLYKIMIYKTDFKTIATTTNTQNTTLMTDHFTMRKYYGVKGFFESLIDRISLMI